MIRFHGVVIYDYSDAYILVSGTISVSNTAAPGRDANNNNKNVIFKNRASFTAKKITKF